MHRLPVTVTGMINIPFDSFGRFSIACTFGSCNDPKSAVAIGMIPDPGSRSRGHGGWSEDQMWNVEG